MRDRLLGVKLDDEVFLDSCRYVRSAWILNERSTKINFVYRQPGNRSTLSRALQGIVNEIQLSTFFFDLDNLTRRNLKRGNIHSRVRDGDVTVPHQLAGSFARRSES
jgi:hypothetical protein